LFNLHEVLQIWVDIQLQYYKPYGL